MKNAALALIVLFVAGPVLALDAYPKTSIAEDITATWCQYCPRAYAGLDIVHAEYDYGQFVSVRYYTESSAAGYGSPVITNRINFYDSTPSLPSVIIDGITWFVGAATSTATTGEPYLSTVGGSMLVPAPVKVEIDSFDPNTGDVSVTVTMYSTTEMLDDDILLLALIEGDVGTTPSPPAYHTHVTRDIVEETFDLTGAGNTYSTTTSFTLDPSWDINNLDAVALVQRAADKEMLQVGSTFPKPDYSIRGMVPFARTEIGPSAVTYETPSLTVVNVGLADTFTINLVIDVAPADWTVAFKDDGGTTHTDPLAFALSNDGSTTFKAIVNANSPGYMQYHFEITSPNLAQPMEIPFTYITDDVDALVVDDDDGEDFEDYFTEALDSAGKTYGVWDRGASPLTTEVADTFDLLIWNVGWAFPSLDDDDKVFLANHLDNGKMLFLSGQDIGWEMNDVQGSPDPVWYHTYLHAFYIQDDSGIMDVYGVDGDLITDGLDLYIDGGTGASNQDYPDEIEPYDADATQILNYDNGSGTYGAAIRSTDSISGGQVVYLGFGFEGIDNAQDRHDLLAPAVRWLQGIIFEDGFESSDTSAWGDSNP